MEAWIQRIRQTTKSPWIRSGALFVLIFLAILGIVSLGSGIGFADVVVRFRVPILITSGIASLLFAGGWSLYRKRQELIKLRGTVDELQRKVNDLEQQKESAFRLMQAYRTQTQEGVINLLKRLAIFGIMQEKWRQKGAKVERLRVEEEIAAVEGVAPELAAQEQTTVMINLGKHDNVMKGMAFIVQDPTDSRKYGVIVVEGVHSQGATCRIVEISDRAFWGDALQALEEGKSCVLEAPSNVIVPDSPLKEISLDSAQQLLVWLQSIERTEL